MRDLSVFRAKGQFGRDVRRRFVDTDSIAMKNSFGKTLETLMRERNLSIRSLSRELDVPPKTIAEWVGSSGRVPRHPENLKKLAEFFTVSVHYLLFGEQDPCSPLSEILEKSEIHTGMYEITIKKVKQRKTE